MRHLCLAAIFCFALPAQALSRWVDSSHAYLLPPGVGEPLSATIEFPLFWWNFAILEFDREPPWELLDPFCKTLARDGSGLVQKMACGQDLTQFKDILREWSADQMRRVPAPTASELRQAMDQGLARAALPLDPFLLQVLREDPTGSYRQLRAKLETNTQLDFEMHYGYFYEPSTRRVVIPVQFTFAPADSAHTRQFMSLLTSTVATIPGARLAGVIGPQASTLENESQIYSDVRRISVLGGILLLGQIAAALALRRWRLLLLAPPVLLSTGLTVVITCLIFGRIHGLTLAFGPGIVGLAMDHGLHSCLNPRWKGAWRANWYGLLTTVVALVAMLFSSIPFLRQLMAFSIIGLFLGFGVYWLLHRRYPHVFVVEPLPIEPKPSAWRFVIVAIMLVGFVFGVARLRPNFSLTQMNFQTPAAAELSKWFFMHLKSKSPLLEIHGGTEGGLLSAVAAEAWGKDNAIAVESVAGFLPSADVQRNNLSQWHALLCAEHKPYSESQGRFFAPFLEGAGCSSDSGPQPKTLGPGEAVPSYLRDFHADGRWISLWLTANPAEVAKVKNHTSSAVSLPEIVDLFPVLVSHEALWMAVLAFILATALLWNYYRDFYLVGLSLVPFFCGVGLFSILALIFSFQISFISLIALVMIFGLSLDYGIFAANLYTGRGGPSVEGVWTSVVLAATVTFLGFLPLAFCHHPVLLQLGQALVWGTAGTILGSMWGVPCLHWALKGRANAPTP